MAYHMALDKHLARFAKRRTERIGITHALHQGGGAAIDETLRQALVQGIGEPVLNLARALLPMARIGQPSGVVRNIGPGADMADARGQGIDIAIRAIEAGDPLGNPRFGNGARAREVQINLPRQADMAVGQGLTEIGNLADIPKQTHPFRLAGLCPHRIVARQGEKGEMVVAIAHAAQAGLIRRPVEAVQQAVQAAEGEVRIAPENLLYLGKTVLFDSLHRIGVKLGQTRCCAEGAIGQVAPGTPGDLRQFGCVEAAHVVAVELMVGREGDMVEIHVEAHADGVRRHQIVNFASLIHRHLSIARARAEGAQDHRAAAALHPHGLGQGIDILSRKGDHGAPWRKAVKLSVAAEGKLGKARPAGEGGLGNEAADQRANGIGAEEHGLEAAARMQ